ncbi:MAG: AraC family transcriptional regulator [Prevotella sp.]|nr:AraC family transcriptional regulator [Prevotella sp.]
MSKESIKDTNIQSIKENAPVNYIGNDIIITDRIHKAPTNGQPHRMNFILLMLCTKGEFRFTIDTQEYSATKNNVIIISDRHVVENYHTSDDAEGMLIILSVGFFYETVSNVSDISTLFLFSRNNHVVSLSQKEADIFKGYCDMLKNKIADTDNQFRRELSRTLILAMFYDMSNVIYRVQTKNDKKQNRADAIFTKFILLVEENYKTERRVGWYAEQLCITPKYLSETVKHVSRRTPNEWIDRYVTLEIRILLRNSTKSIKEIATDMCFPNQSFLGKYFKEHVGMSPSEYRKS